MSETPIPQPEPTVDVFSPDGVKGKIPVSKEGEYFGQGFKAAVRVTTPEGQGGWLPSDKVHDYMTTKGFKVGPPNQQSIPEANLSPVFHGIQDPYGRLREAADTIGRVKQGADTGMDAMLDTPGQVYHAFADAPTAAEGGPNAYPMNGRVTLGLKRLVTDPMAAERAKAAPDLQQGHTSEAVAHSVAGSIPLVGPFASHMGEQAGKDPAAALGEGIVYQAVPKIVGKSVKELATSPKQVSSALTTTAGKTADMVKSGVQNVQASLNPVKAAELLPADALAIKATKPRNSIQNVKGQLSTALPDARRAADNLGIKVSSLDEANQAVGQAKRDVWKEYADSHLQPGKDAGLTIDGNKIADAMEGTLNKRYKTQNPQAAQAIRDLADQYRRPLPVAEAEDFLQGANNDLASYYAKNKVNQRTASLDPTKGHVVAEANAIRSELYKALDGLSGSDAAALKKRYGALNTLEDIINRRINVAERAAPESLIEQMGKMEATMAAVKGAGKIITGRPLSGIGDIVAARQGLKSAKLSRQANDANFLISKSFEKTSATPAARRTVRDPKTGRMKVQFLTSPSQPRSLADILGNQTEATPEPASGAPVTPVQPPKGNAPVTEERGIKPPQKRTFERVSDKDVKDFFSYRFDQLRSELKAAQESGDQAAVADVQRRMGELDQIQRSPRSLQDVLAGKPPQAAKAASAGTSRSLSDILSGKPQDNVTLNSPKLPQYLRDTIQQDFQTAQRLGIVPDIEKLSADGLVAKQITARLKDKFGGTPITDRAQLVRSVRAARGIPSQDNMAEFEQWRQQYRKGGK